MKFVSYKLNGRTEKGYEQSTLSNRVGQLGFVYKDEIFPIQVLGADFPRQMLELMQGGKVLMKQIQEAFQGWKANNPDTKNPLQDSSFELLAPLANPISFRDAYAFRQHVETSRKNRGLDMIPEFDEFPVFYFSNHLVISGPGEVEVEEAHLDSLDYELEIAIVINKEGKNIKAEHADEYIGGFMILNDWSARKLQMDEMKLNLGPAKGKDFATSIAPWLVTPDELTEYLTDPFPGHIGNAYDLNMSAKVNGITLSEGNFKSMNWTFAEVIERISYGVTLYPGDLIGSGTVGTGCLLELNGTGRRADPENFQAQWLQVGDCVEFEIDQLGKLSNTIVKAK